MDKKKILAITHQLSRTGAPIVLLDMLRLCQRHGYDVEVIAMLDGELYDDLEKLNIPCRIKEIHIRQPDDFLSCVKEYDLVIANTLIAYEAIHLLRLSDVPVLWWIHEGRQYFEYFKSVIPDIKKLPAHIHVHAVGHYVQDVIKELYGCKVDVLHFGVDDVPRKRAWHAAGQTRVKFLTVGTYSWMKAQDLLAQAIRLLSEEYHERAEFVFCGNETMYDEAVYQEVKLLADAYSNVSMLPGLAHSEALALMEESSCMVVPSRIDPIPTVAVEMLMKENLCICTDICGIAHYIQDGKNGFAVPAGDAAALKDKIEFVIDHNQCLDPVRKEGRRIYEQHFSWQAVEPQMLHLLRMYTCEGKPDQKDVDAI